MARAWQIVADVCAGTLQLRERGAIYLPQESAERPEHYSYRLSRAIFFNAFERTLNALVGMVFRKDPALSADAPEAIRGREASDEVSVVEGQWENIDNAGAHGAVFCKEVFTNAMRDGHAAILVDMPPALPEGASLEDERRAGRRPYWVSYEASQIINWRTRNVGGQTKLDLIVFRECATEADGEYGEKEVIRYRVMRPGMWAVYRESRDEKGLVTTVLESEGATSLPEIPVAVIYIRKTGALCSRPPLLDLAIINLAHYQKYSDLSVYLHLCRPILCRKGSDLKPVQVISAYTVMDTSADGQVYFAEPSGGGLAPAREDLKDLEARMAVMGLSMLTKRTAGPGTATEELLDHVKEESDLATAARSLKDAIELCLKFHAQYLDPKATSGGSVELGATMESLTLTAQDVQAYSSLVANKQLSLESLWAVLARAGKLPEDFDPEKERAAIEADSEDLADKMLSAFDSGDGGTLTEQGG